MRWAVNLYTTEKTRKKLPVILRKLGRKKITPGIWLITIASNEQNLLDIFHSIYYQQSMFEKMNPDIVGIAGSEAEAGELVVKIVEDVWKQNGNFDVRAFFKFQE